MIIISLINSQYNLVKTDMDETCQGAHTSSGLSEKASLMTPFTNQEGCLIS